MAASDSPVAGANWNPWPLQAELTITGPWRSVMNRSSGVLV